jgi:protein-disulfide isomerase
MGGMVSIGKRWALGVALFCEVVLTSCGGTQSGPCVDEAALRARIRHELIVEMRSNERLAALRGGEGAAPDEPLAAEEADRIRVEPGDGPRRGARDPLVTIVMFSDFECPFCARVEPTLARLLEEHPQEVQIVWRNLPLAFHQSARPAAAAAMEAFEQGGDAMFWRYHALLFDNRQALSRADLEQYATRVGMNVADLGRALDDDEHEARLRTDEEVAQRVGARGTPTFFVNGRVIPGAQPFERFDELVREEIALARRDLARGVPRAELYARRMRDAAEAAPEPEPPPSRPARRQPDPAAVYRVPVEGRPSRGRADALVTIVVFSEFQCPFCRRVLPTIEQVEERYGREVRFVFRHNPLPFHQNALPAALVGEEVFRQRGAAAFFRYHDLAFENQQELERDRLIEYARRAGANPRRVAAALDERRHLATIEADQELAQSLGARGTPTFFINGRSLRGAQPFDAFAALIDEELARARERVAAGSPRRRIYAELLAAGATEPQFLDGEEGGAPSAPTDDPVYRIALPDRTPARGPADAPITIQIFSDFQCPFCNRVRPTLDRLLSEHSDVRLVWRDYPLPFHQNAMPAAQAAREVFRQRGNDAFWRFHDLVFENQRALDVDSLVQLAGRIPGVNAARVRRALERETHRAAVEADMRAVRDANAQIGTPSFFINGRLLQGAQPYEAFRQAVERARREGRR